MRSVLSPLCALIATGALCVLVACGDERGAAKPAPPAPAAAPGHADGAPATTKICPTCGATIPARAKYCLECGTRQ
jgi:hypothetical protein